MQYELFEYQDGEINLSFKFQKKESLAEDKKKFVELLKQAQKDIEESI